MYVARDRIDIASSRVLHIRMHPYKGIFVVLAGAQVALVGAQVAPKGKIEPIEERVIPTLTLGLRKDDYSHIPVVVRDSTGKVPAGALIVKMQRTEGNRVDDYVD